jgi:hypothetical protein
MDKNIKIFNKQSTNKYREKNFILSKNIEMNIENSFNNFLIVGRAGSGVSNNFILPNILKANSNYIIVDEGSIFKKTKNYFENLGYNVYLFDFMKSSESNGINLLKYFDSKSLHKYIYGKHCFDIESLNIIDFLYRTLYRYFDNPTLKNFYYLCDIYNLKDFYDNIFDSSTLKTEFKRLNKYKKSTFISELQKLKNILDENNFKKILDIFDKDDFNLNDIINDNIVIFIKPHISSFLNKQCCKFIEYLISYVKNYYIINNKNKKTISFFLDRISSYDYFENLEIFLAIKSSNVKLFISIYSIDDLKKSKNLSFSTVDFDFIIFLSLDTISLNFLTGRLNNYYDINKLKFDIDNIKTSFENNSNCLIFLTIPFRGLKFFIDKKYF